MTTTLEKYLVEHGISIMEAARRMGINYVHVWRHCTGRRRVTADYAMRYHKTLGIPRSELRPDLWPPTEETDTRDTQGGANGSEQ